MARRKSATPATAFTEAVRFALEHISDPEWLGSHSPLATPYFLGISTGSGLPVAASAQRGRSLQEALHQAAAGLWGGALPATRGELAAQMEAERSRLGNSSPRYRYFLLELRYFRRHFRRTEYPTTVETMADLVSVSTTRFYVHLDEAIAELGRRLLESLNPVLRLEQPSLTREPVGRAGMIATIQEELLSGKSVAVTGVGGVGKTTLGAALAAQWPGDIVFWHTFRPGLNDDPESLLFNLGHYFYQQGAPSLWAQLMAREGKTPRIGEAMGMLQLDLESIAHRRPLLCFDEVDLLHTSARDPRRIPHAQVLELLESLRGSVPLLFMGQRIYVDTDAHHTVESLTPTELGALLSDLGASAGDSTLLRIHRFTRGNPRLTELYAALRKTGESDRDILALAADPSAQPLFNRLWRRLDEPERSLLCALSVYRSYAPRTSWSHPAEALNSLIDRQLVKTDLAGGVELLPFFRELVYETLSNDQRRQLHRAAAHVRAQHGSYTAAAHHFRLADNPAAAVEVWYAHQDEEIMNGHAAAATEVFALIDESLLPGHIRNRLRVIRNRLALLAGEVERVLIGMDGFAWETDDETTAMLIGQWALAHEQRDHADDALARYDEAIGMLSRIAIKTMNWRMRRGSVLLQNGDAQAARSEAELARYDIERLLGTIALDTGQFEQAQSHYSIALEIAEAAGDLDRIARAHQMLALVAGRQGLIELAESHAAVAIDHFGEIGDRLQLEGMRAELAGMYLNVRRFEDVIEPAQRALSYFERIKHDVWIAHIRNNLAEAYMETGRLDLAKALVLQVRQMEIIPTLPNALYTLGHIYDREGHVEYAVASFREGIEIARQVEDPFIEAYLRRALGTLLARSAQGLPAPPLDAIEQLETSRELFHSMGLHQEAGATERILAKC